MLSLTEGNEMNQDLELTSILSERIKRIRNALNLSQAAFARRLGVNRAHVSRIESGKSAPSEQLLKLIQLEYRVSGAWLVKGIGRMELDFDEYISQQQEIQAAVFGSELDIFFRFNVFLLRTLIYKLEGYTKKRPGDLRYGPLPPAAVDKLKLVKSEISFSTFSALIDEILSHPHE